MVIIKSIEEPVCTLFNSDGELVGSIKNMLSLSDVRLQIKRQSLIGYYIKWDVYTILIDKFGNLSEWPKGFYDDYDILIDEFIGI